MTPDDFIPVAETGRLEDGTPYGILWAVDVNSARYTVRAGSEKTARFFARHLYGAPWVPVNMRINTKATGALRKREEKGRIQALAMIEAANGDESEARRRFGDDFVAKWVERREREADEQQR